MLTSGKELYQGDYINSSNGYYATIQTDGNFVIYSGKSFQPKHAIWATHTNGHGSAPFRIVMQNDGNLCIYDKHNKCTWASNTCGKGPSTLRMQEDRNLVIYDAHGKATWASNTCA